MLSHAATGRETAGFGLDLVRSKPESIFFCNLKKQPSGDEDLNPLMYDCNAFQQWLSSAGHHPTPHRTRFQWHCAEGLSPSSVVFPRQAEHRLSELEAEHQVTVARYKQEVCGTFGSGAHLMCSWLHVCVGGWVGGWVWEGVGGCGFGCKWDEGVCALSFANLMWQITFLCVGRRMPGYVRCISYSRLPPPFTAALRPATDGGAAAAVQPGSGAPRQHPGLLPRAAAAEGLRPDPIA